MKLFQNLFNSNAKDNSIKIGAPISGKLVSIKEVSDPTFGEEILGKGAAVIPDDGKVYAPADGTVSTVFPTGHAVAMATDDGVEILIHVGLDTVKLDGKHFTIHAQEDQKVKKGDLLLEVDLGQVKAEGYDTITPVVICNSDDFAEITMAQPKDVVHGDEILTLQK